MTAGLGEAGERLFSPGFTAIAASMLAFFSAGGMFLPVTPRFAAGPLGETDLAVGVAIGSFAIASLVLRPFVGRLADRRGRRPLLIAGAIVTVVATFGHLAAGDLALLIAMRLLLGAGEALFFVAGMAATTDLAPEHRRGEAISIMSLALYLGVAIGPVAGETVFGLGGYSAVWIVSGVVALVAVVLSWFAPETLDVGARGADSGRLLHPRGIVPGLLVLCGAWGMGAYFAFLPLLTDELELEGTGPLFALYALIVVGLRIVGAKLPDRLGAARLSGAALATSAVGLTIAGLAPTPTGLAIATVVFATGTAFTFPAIMALAVAGVSPGARGSVVGTASLFLDAAFGLSPAVLGLLAGFAGYPSVFLVSAAVALAGSIALAVLRPGRTR